jgi:hypothetical protein
MGPIDSGSYAEGGISARQSSVYSCPLKVRLPRLAGRLLCSTARMSDKGPLIGKVGVLAATAGTPDEIREKETQLICSGYRLVTDLPLDAMEYCREEFFDGEVWRFSLQWMEPSQH